MIGGPGVPFTFHKFVQSLTALKTCSPGSSCDPGDRRSSVDFSYRVPRLRKWLTFYGDAFTQDECRPIALWKQRLQREQVRKEHQKEQSCNQDDLIENHNAKARYEGYPSVRRKPPMRHDVIAVLSKPANGIGAMTLVAEFWRRDQHSIDVIKSLRLGRLLMFVALALNPGRQPLVDITAT
jgi:hypothetical protein